MYKRQGLPNPCACFTFIYRINKKSLAVAIRHFYPIPGTPSTAVSYTHLDVYKRQLALQVAFFTSNKTAFNFGLEYCINVSMMSPTRMFPSYRSRVFSSSFVVLVMSKVFRKSTSSPNRTPLIDSASNSH